MALDTLGQLKAVTIPRWVRAVALIIALTFFGVSCWVSVTGLQDSSRKDWFQAGLQLIGAIAPLLIIVLLFSFASTGMDSLIRRTERFLCVDFPRQLQFTVNRSPEFAPAGQEVKAAKVPDLVSVALAKHPGDYLCHYRIGFPDTEFLTQENCVRLRRAYVSIELKVQHVSVVMHFERGALDALLPSSEPASVNDYKLERGNLIHAAFQITLDGAERSGCRVDKGVIINKIDNRPCYSLVVIRDVTQDFLFNESEQLFVLQDVCSLLRSCWMERPELFPYWDDSTTQRGVQT